MLLQTFLLFHVLTSLGPIAHGSEIINGVKVPEDEMLFMASMQSNGRHICGGFLITEDFVLTAAHCSFGLTHVVVGAHDLGNLKKPQTQKIRIEKEFPHSCFTYDVPYGDIMLLKLSKKARMNNRVATIKLSASRPDANEQCHVVGWGMTRTRGPGVDELMMVDVPIISRAVCKKKWKEVLDKSDPWSNLPPNVICAGGYETTKGACQGDSGGPLVCNNQAVGIVSYNWAGNCSYPNAPNVYTDISAYQDWIDSVIKGEIFAA